MLQKKCIIIAGPTASGKTTLSLKLAELYQTDIISADSRQCYKELNIGVAKPSTAELNQVQHYFINSHSIHQNVNAGVFESYAKQAVDEIFKTKDFAILVGGTGLYINAFARGMDNIPEVDTDIRVTSRTMYEKEGMVWLKEMLEKHDPLFYEKGEMKNPHRMLRALEVKLSSGKSILHYQSERIKTNDYSIVKIGVSLPRTMVYENINTRVDVMMDLGLLDEVKELAPYRNLNALKTVGYTELFDYLDGKHTLDKAVEEIKKNTRHYAKRQLTWFNRDEEMQWLPPNNIQQIQQAIHEAGSTY